MKRYLSSSLRMTVSASPTSPPPFFLLLVSFVCISSSMTFPISLIILFCVSVTGLERVIPFEMVLGG